MNFDEFYRTISQFPLNKIVIVGLGNSLRGDDGAGIFLVRLLKQDIRLKEIRFLEAGTNPENYLQKILDFKARLVIFIDAAVSHQQAGTLSWLPNDRLDSAAISTHAFSMKMVEDYLHNEDPSLEIKYLIIEPKSYALNPELSKPVLYGIYSFLNVNQP